MKLSLKRKGLVRIGIIGSILLALIFFGFLVFNFIIPTFAVPAITSNTTSPATGAKYDISSTYVFNASFVETNASDSITNVTFQLGRPDGTITNYTNSTATCTICPFNGTATNFSINFSQGQLGGAGTYNYSWYARNQTNQINITVSDISYVINAATTSMNLTINRTAGAKSINRSSLVNFTAEINVSNAVPSLNITILANFSGTSKPFAMALINNTTSTRAYNLTDTTNLEIGVYNITAWFPGTTNYTRSQVDYILNVSDSILPVVTIARPSTATGNHTKGTYIQGTTTDLFEINITEVNLNLTTNVNATLNYKKSGATAWIALTLNCWGASPKWTCNKTIDLSEGSYANNTIINFFFNVSDMAGNWGNNGTFTAYLNATIDRSVPNISTISPASNANLSGSFLINASVDDNYNVSYVRYQLNNGTWADSWFQMTNSTNPNSTGGALYNATNRTDNADIADGVYNITSWVNDTANNIYQVNRTVRFDNTAPIIILYNSSGETFINITRKINGTFIMNASISDSGSGASGSCNVTLINSTATYYATPLISISDNWCNGTVSLPTTVSKDMNYTLRVNVSDFASNMGSNNTQGVVIDNTGPSMKNISTNTTVNIVNSTTSFTLTINVTDNTTSISGVFLNSSTGTYSTSLARYGTSTGYYTVNNTTGLGCSGTSCVLTVTANDTLNNTNTSSITITVDNTKPVLVALNPPNTSTYISGNGSDVFQVNVTEQNLRTDKNATLQYREQGTTDWSVVTLNCFGTAPGWTCNKTVDLTGLGQVNVQYYFNATDNATNEGWNGSAANPNVVTIDRTGPTVANVQLNKTAVNASDGIMVNATVTDNNVSTVYVRINEVQSTMTSIGSNKYQYNYSVTGLTNGVNYTINVTGVDTASNVGSNTTLSITYDNSAPTNITILAPTTLQNLTGSVTVNVTVHDNSNVTVDTVRFNISNTSWSNLTVMTRYNGNVAQGNYSAVFGSSSLRDGSYNISVIANDTIGNTNNTGISVNVNITFDNTNPSITILSPTTNANISATSFLINITATDGSGSGLQVVGINISNVTAVYSNASWSVVNGTWNLTQIGDYWNVTFGASANNLTDGAYNLTVNATDFAGNANRTENITIVIDKTVPKLIMFNSTGDGFFPNLTINKTGGTFTLGVIINDTRSTGAGTGPNGTCNVTMVNTTGNVFYPTPLLTVVGSAASAYCNGTVTVPTIARDDNYTIYVNVSDFASNQGYNDTYAMQIDNTGPAVTSLTTNSTISGNNTANASTLLNITVTVSDAISSIHRVMLNNTVMVQSGSSSTFFTTNTTTQLGCSSTGSCVLAVSANDTLNNTNSTTSIIVTVDATVPAISIITPIADQNITGSYLINASVNDNINVSYVRYQIINSSGLIPNGTGWVQMTNSTNPNSTGGALFNATNNSALYVDGVFNITFWANDTVNNIYQINRTVRFDRAGPQILLYNYTNGTNVVSGQNYFFNIFVNDSNSGVNNSIVLNVTIGGNATTQISLTAMNSSTEGWYNGSVAVPSNLEAENKTLIFNITDRAGNVGTNNSLVINVTTDTVGPTVVLFNTTGDGFFANATWKRAGDTLNINASLSDTGSGITGNCNVTMTNSTDMFNATPLITRSSSWCNGTVTIPATATRDMNYTLRVNVSDIAGNIGSNNTYVIGIDNTGPTLVIYNATGSFLMNGTAVRPGQAFAINVSINDTNLTSTGAGVGVTASSCTVLINTSSAGSLTYSSGWCNGSITIPAAGLNQGNLTLNVTINDTLNNTGYNTSLVVLVDSTLPVITVLTPSNGTYVNVSTDKRIWVNGTVYDNFNRTNATTMGANNVTINDTRFNVSTFNAQNNTAFNITNNSAVTDGYVSLLLNYTDAAGNNANATVYFYEDSTPPSTVSGNTTGTQSPNGTQTITVTVIDNLLTNSTITLHYALKGIGTWSSQTWNTATMSGTPGTTTVYTATINTEGLSANSTIGYYVSGIDNATNSISTATGGNSTTPLTNFTIGTIGAIDGYVLRNGTTTLVSGVTVSDGTRAAVTNSNGYYVISNVPAGTYTVTASATDYVTNSTSSVTVSAGATTRVNLTMAYNTTGTIQGYVKSNDTTPVLLVNVIVTDGTRAAVTSINGNYTITGVPPGTYTLNVSKTDYISNSTTGIVVTAGATTNVNLTMANNASGTIDGYIYLTNTTSTVPNSSVRVSDGSRTVFTNNAGYYLITSVPPGAYTLTAGGTNGYWTNSTSATVSPGTTTRANMYVTGDESFNITIPGHTISTAGGFWEIGWHGFDFATRIFSPATTNYTVENLFRSMGTGSSYNYTAVWQQNASLVWTSFIPGATGNTLVNISSSDDHYWVYVNSTDRVEFEPIYK